MSRKLSIKQISKMFDLSPVYIRRALLKGDLQGEKIQIMTNTYKWVVDVEEVKKWRSSRTNSGRRKDGRNKFNIYCSESEYSKLMKVLEENKLSLPLRRSNKPRN